ncbi:MAG: MFS transporter [Woeseiaceae bacterium]|nr:MFS transporter [Woeseiaceae bacterium]
MCPPRYYSFVSSLGFSIGYLGGAVLLVLHVLMLTSPETFGIADATQATKLAFISVGAWWALFMAPLFLFVPEHPSSRQVSDHVVRAAYRELRDTISHIAEYRNVVIFLIAYWLYIGGVFTVITMAVNFGQRLGFPREDLVQALLITNFAGFPATLIYGWFGHRFGAKKGIYFAIAVYTLIASFAVFITDVREFYVMAVIIGCVQGGVQGLSRSLYASLIPKDAPGEFFGFYNMVTKFSHVLGPALVAVGAMMSDNPKVILLALLPLFIGGGMLLTVVRETRASE